MPLIKSISGIRGTIGGLPSENLTPIDVVKYTAAYGSFIQQNSKKNKIKLIIGRDARISGEMIQSLVQNTLIAMGIDIVDLGLSTTPTVEMSVVASQADGGIILTASHNPKQWNALKLLNAHGEFLNAEEGAEILALAESNQFEFTNVDDLGSLTHERGAIEAHIAAVMKHPLVNFSAIKTAKFKAVVDGVNSVGGIAIPQLLKALGVECIPLYCDPTWFIFFKKSMTYPCKTITN